MYAINSWAQRKKLPFSVPTSNEINETILTHIIESLSSSESPVITPKSLKISKKSNAKEKTKQNKPKNY